MLRKAAISRARWAMPSFTQAETWEELRANVLEAVSLHFENSSAQPRLVQLHYLKDELIPVEAA
jgi:hypothetical protein